jgi:hypothetical protein
MAFSFLYRLTRRAFELVRVHRMEAIAKVKGASARIACVTLQGAGATDWRRARPGYATGWKRSLLSRSLRSRAKRILW